MANQRFDRYSRLQIEQRDHGVMLITLSNPGKLNATDAVMHAELSTIFADVHASPEVRAVVVTGEGKAFSAGGDLDWISGQVGNHPRTMAAMREGGDIVRTMIECDTPVIAAINGVAVGAGLAVALLADISIIDQDTTVHRRTHPHRRCRRRPCRRDLAVAVRDGQGQVLLVDQRFHHRRRSRADRPGIEGVACRRSTAGGVGDRRTTCTRTARGDHPHQTCAQPLAPPSAPQLRGFAGVRDAQLPRRRGSGRHHVRCGRSAGPNFPQ